MADKTTVYKTDFWERESLGGSKYVQQGWWFSYTQGRRRWRAR